MNLERQSNAEVHLLIVIRLAASDTHGAGRDSILHCTIAEVQREVRE